MRSWFRRFRRLLFSPVDLASLVTFRIAFGAIMVWEVVCYFLNGWIGAYWIEPVFHFTYPGFEWVKPWPGNGMYVHFAILGVLAAFIAAGFFYRVSTTLFFLGFTYTFLLERARYLNHFYFVCLVSFLMIWVPTHRASSLDALFRPRLRADAIPFWSLWLLRGQLAIVYLYSGVAKLNSDWLRGEPLGAWLRELNGTPLIGPLFEWPGTFVAIAWAGAGFDLFIVPLLIWKRTRTVAFLAALSFHLLNAWFFTIGIFPWFSIAMTTLFFEPDWPRRLLYRLGLSRLRPAPDASVAKLGVTGPARNAAAIEWTSTPRQRRTFALISLYVGFQILFPLRHWLYPGDVAWTEEGHEFSWRMKLRGKIGQTIFVVRNPATQELWFESADGYLEPWQAKKMRTRPDLIRQFAHHLAAISEKAVGTPVKVRVQAQVALNGHPAERLIDPEVDLSDEPYRLAPSPWITPRPSSQQ